MADSSSDSEVEGDIESVFNEAANVVQTNAVGSGGVKPTDAQLLELYGLYKVSTCGPCSEPQPGIFNMKARSKWSAWKENSTLPKAEAMDQYVKKVCSIFNWIPDTELTGSTRRATSGGGGFAPAVSRPPVPEDVESKNTPFDWVKDNEMDKISDWVSKVSTEIGNNLNICDDDGLSLLHWAVDRGRKEICEILLKAGADPAIKDEEESTPLDYAITCDHQDIIKLLKTHQIVTLPT